MWMCKTYWLLIAGAVMIAGCGTKKDDDGGGDDHRVDETGYFTAGLIHYSSAELIASAGDEIQIVGLPAALSPTDGVLSASNLTTGADATLTSQQSDGSFVVRILASLKDEVQLNYQVDDTSDEMVIVLIDDLNTRPRPFSAATTGLLTTLTNGTIEVALSGLSDPSVHVVFNQTNGASILTAADAISATVAGVAGDTVCIFQLDVTSGAASPTLCETAT